MKVLSIDLDYITGPTAELFSGLWHDINPIIRWKELYDNSDFTESHLSIDTGGLIYCYHLFLKALKNNPKVVFAYEHDAILYELRNHDNIDIDSEDTIALLNRYVEESESNINKSQIQTIIHDIYKEACELV